MAQQSNVIQGPWDNRPTFNDLKGVLAERLIDCFILAGENFLDKIDNITTDEFRLAGEKREREKFRTLLETVKRQRWGE